MSRHESFRATGPKDLAGIIQFLNDGGLPDTRWSMSELQVPRGYISSWPHWNTPLHRMIATKQRDGIEYLLDHDASVDFCNSLGRTPLQEAIRLEYYEGVELLLTRGADLSVPSQGRSAGNEIGDHDDPAGKDVYVLPIHEALKNGDTQMVQILVRAGADINKPSEGWRPLDLALIDRQVNIIDALFELGASFSSTQETEACEQNQRKEAAQGLLRAASHTDWFPPPSCHPLFVSVLATCNVNQYTVTETSGKQTINSDKLIRDFFKAVSSIAQRINIEPTEDTLCSLCFQYQTLSTYPSCSCLGEGTSQTSAGCFRHHDNLDSLASSAKSGCRLCRTFLQALNLVKNHRSGVSFVLTKYLQLPPKPDVFLHLHRPDRIFVTVGDLAAELGFGYLNESTIKQSPSIDDYENGTSSSSSFQIAKAWLHSCITSHETCGHVSAALPTRVIDVGDGSRDPFLFETKGAHHSYCALSYCWGTVSNAHQTTTKNLQRYYAAIPPRELPRTLLDAIHAARAMGFKYIWIDALCIIQDDNDDWSREAVKMTQVYANAALTITTSVGGSSHDGLFRAHPDGFFNPQQLYIRLPKRDRIREKAPIRDLDLSVVRHCPTRPLSYLAVYPDANFPYIGFAYIGAVGSPVETRAWTLQEQILSRRILYYGNGAILWECLDVSASEHDPDGVRHGIQFPDRWKIKQYFHSHMASQPQSTTYGMASNSEAVVLDKPFATYCRLLETYGNRSITKPSDRITAILGLGQIMQKVSGNEFIGGIWKGGHTLASLLWSIEVPSPKARTSNFPTWSWASVSPESEENRVFNNLGETEQAVQWRAKVISFGVQSNLAQTEVKGGITLEGRLGRLRDDESYIMSVKGALRTTPYVFVDLAADTAALENDLDNIWCFEMVTLSGAGDLPSKACLLLRRVDCAGSPTFERIGVYQHITSPEDAGEVQRVVLV
ncbi:heterokaryon incompatibility protein-domain-containing protein [Xylaria digitata]|nr:heterokaryon incompatibility protein-domain-containing protein [Xylaria digitata]